MYVCECVRWGGIRKGVEKWRCRTDKYKLYHGCTIRICHITIKKTHSHITSTSRNIITVPLLITTISKKINTISLKIKSCHLPKQLFLPATLGAEIYFLMITKMVCARGMCEREREIRGGAGVKEVVNQTNNTHEYKKQHVQ